MPRHGSECLSQTERKRKHTYLTLTIQFLAIRHGYNSMKYETPTTMHAPAVVIVQ